jgi:cell division protein DivIC
VTRLAIRVAGLSEGGGMTRGKKRRLGMLPQMIALLLVLGLAGAMAIQPTRQLLEQRDRIADMTGDLERVNESNDALRDRVNRLNDPDYLEQVARESGYARPGETVYNVVPPSRKEQKQQEKRRANKEQPAPEPEPGFMERFLNFVGLG